MARKDDWLSHIRRARAGQAVVYDLQKATTADEQAALVTTIMTVGRTCEVTFMEVQDEENGPISYKMMVEVKD